MEIFKPTINSRMFQLGTYRVSHLAVRQGHVTLLDAGMVPQLQHAAARYTQDRLNFLL